MTDLAAAARAAALHCEAKKDALRQTQDGLWKVTFTVSPLDMPADLMAARPGTRYMLALVEIGDDEEPKTSGPLAAGVPRATADSPIPPEQTPKAPDKQRMSRAASSQDRVVQRCAILCADERFQRWLGRQDWTRHRAKDETPDEWAAEMVRNACHVVSRRDLAINNDARKKWDALLLAYEQAVGLAPVDHRRMSA